MTFKDLIDEKKSLTESRYDGQRKSDIKDFTATLVDVYEFSEDEAYKEFERLQTCKTLDNYIRLSRVGSTKALSRADRKKIWNDEYSIYFYKEVVESEKRTFTKDDLSDTDAKEMRLIKKGETFYDNKGVQYKAVEVKPGKIVGVLTECATKDLNDGEIVLERYDITYVKKDFDRVVKWYDSVTSVQYDGMGNVLIKGKSKIRKEDYRTYKRNAQLASNLAKAVADHFGLKEPKMQDEISENILIKLDKYELNEAVKPNVVLDYYRTTFENVVKAAEYELDTKRKFAKMERRILSDYAGNESKLKEIYKQLNNIANILSVEMDELDKIIG